MSRARLILIFTFCAFNLKAQLKFFDKIDFFDDVELGVIGGPNLTNIVSIRNNEIAFFASPIRPFYKFNYLFGAEMRKDLNESMKLSSSLFYERISNAQWGFNQDLFDKLDFMVLNLGLTYKPIVESKLELLFGANIYYSTNREREVLFILDEKFQFALNTGLAYDINDKLSFSLNYSQAISSYTGASIFGSVKRYTLAHSFQAIFKYFIYEL